MGVDNKLLMDAVAAINARFSSGNSVPVDRAWVSYAEWKNLQYALALALTPPECSDQNLLELAATFETCIPFLPSAGQRNIGKAVAQLRHMAMGFVLVPVEPTEEEVRATNEAQQEFFGDNVQSQFFSSGHYMEESIRHALRAVRSARPEVKP